MSTFAARFQNSFQQSLSATSLRNSWCLLKPRGNAALLHPHVPPAASASQAARIIILEVANRKVDFLCQSASYTDGGVHATEIYVGTMAFIVA